MHTFFADIILNIGGKRISSNTGFNSQIYSIFNRLGTSMAMKNTIQFVEGGFEDQDGKQKDLIIWLTFHFVYQSVLYVLLLYPDKLSAFDAGFVSRQEMFCSSTINKRKVGMYKNV